MTTTLARIDEEIIKQKSALLDLYTQRNSLSSICRLPTEILTTIFIHCARDHHEANRDTVVRFLPLRAVPNWVNVSYVCRHWRDAALDCSTLWSYVFLTSLHWTEELLARSKQTPLKIWICVKPELKEHWWLSFVERVMNHTERIQDLFLHVHDTAGINPLYSKLLSSCAPRLQRILIVGGASKWSSMLFIGNTPVLRTLELSGCPMPWNSFKSNGLTTLHLKKVPESFRQSMKEFLAVLTDMQGLRHLYLENALASARDFLDSDVSNLFPKINLPCLSGLLVVAPLSTVVMLLSCINIPPKTELRLECYHEPGFSDNFTLFSSHLAQRFASSALSGPPIRSLVVMPWNRRMVKFTFSTSEHDRSPAVISSDNWGSNIPLKIAIGSLLDTSMPEDRVDYMTRNICDRFSMLLTNVQSIDVIEPPLWSAFWKNILGHLHNLRCIKLSHGHMPDLASVLSLTLHECAENHDRSPNQLFAPALEELELSYIRFAPESASERDLQSLCDALSTRKESRGRLTMTQCCIARESSYRNLTEIFDMLGWWMGGHFHMISTVCDSGLKF